VLIIGAVAALARRPSEELEEETCGALACAGDNS